MKSLVDKSSLPDIRGIQEVVGTVLTNKVAGNCVAVPQDVIVVDQGWNCVLRIDLRKKLKTLPSAKNLLFSRKIMSVFISKEKESYCSKAKMTFLFIVCK